MRRLRAAHLALGRRGEEAAARLLLAKGYTLLARNWRVKAGELDIVARDGAILVFVEVKTRSSVHFANPEDAVDYRKMKHLINAAEAYMAINNIDKDFRFDILAIAVIGNRYHFNHIEDAFMPPVL